MIPRTIVLGVSQNWPDLGFLEEKLVESLGQAPGATYRLPSAAHGGGREARVFLESVGAKVEVWSPDNGWPKNAAEIRNAAMLRGYEFDPARLSEKDESGWPYPRELKPRADLVVVFAKGGNDVAGDILKRALALAYPAVAYRPHKKGIQRAASDPEFALRLLPWRPVLREAREEAA